eukprot:UN05822
MKITFELKKGTLRLVRALPEKDYKKVVPKSLLDLNFTQTSVDIAMRPTSMLVNLQLQTLDCNDYITEGAPDSKMISRLTESKDPLFKLTFEQNPLKLDADVMIALDTQPLTAVLRPLVVVRLGKFFTPQKEVDFSALET